MRDTFLACILLVSVGCADPSAPWEGSGATIARNSRGGIVGINLAEAVADDMHLAQLATLPHLTTLTLGASVGDAELVTTPVSEHCQHSILVAVDGELVVCTAG